MQVLKTLSLVQILITVPVKLKINDITGNLFRVWPTMLFNDIVCFRVSAVRMHYRDEFVIFALHIDCIIMLRCSWVSDNDRYMHLQHMNAHVGCFTAVHNDMQLCDSFAGWGCMMPCKA